MDEPETRGFLRHGATQHGWLEWLAIWPLALTTAVTACAQPVTNQAVVASLDFDLDGEIDGTYEYSGVDNSPNNPNYYFCVYFLRYTPHLRFLRVNSMRPDFAAGQLISASNANYVNGGGDNDVALLGYHAEWKIPGYWEFYQRSIPQFYDDKPELFIGFRFTRLEVGTQHHGWLRFTRPDTNFTTAFELVAYDWNPLPGQPIAAGLPPAIPLHPQVTAEGLQLEWPPEVADWVLEASDQLGPLADWQPVPDAYGPLVLLPLPETNRFYRLRRP